MTARPKMKALALDMKVAPDPKKGLRRPLLAIDVDRPLPSDLRDDEALVETQYTAYCGTDYEMSSKPGHGIPTERFDTLNLIGHESVGKVVARGRSVRLKEGDLVVPMVREGGGCIACQAGRADMCLDGDFKEHGIFRLSGFATPCYVMQERYLIPVPPGLPPDVAVLGEVSSICGKAWAEAEIVAKRYPGWGRSGSAALVLGAGAVGLLMSMLLRSKGFEVVTAARTRSNPSSPHRKAHVLEQMGARYVSTQDIPVADLRKASPTGRYDLIFEATGNSTIICEALQGLLGPGVILVLASITGGHEAFPLKADKFNEDAVMGNSTVFGVVNACDRHFAAGLEVLRWWQERKPGMARELLTTRFDSIEATAAGVLDSMASSDTIRAYTRFAREA